MSADKTKVLNILEMRFDYQSSRNVLNNWRKAAGIRDDSESLNDEALKSLLSYLKDNAADAVRVHSAIERMILSNDVEEVKVVEAPVVEEVAVEAPVVEEVAVEAPVVEEVAVEAPVVEEVVEVAEVAEDAADAVADDAAADADNAEAPAENSKKKKKSKH